MKKQKAIVVDLEGTLSNCDHRIHHLQNKDYDSWNAGFVNDSPNLNLISALAELQSDGYAIIISTAKSCDYQSCILSWLRVHMAPHPWKFYTRGANLNLAPSVEIKQNHLSMIEEKFDVQLFIDDREENCKVYQDNEISTIHHCGDDPRYLQLIAVALERPGHYKSKAPAGDKKEKAPITTPESLRASADIFEERGKAYGKAYKEFGPILKSFFPNGIELKTELEMNRFAPFLLILVKIQRYANNFKTGGHSDSLVDISTYSAMLNELDSEL